MILDLKSEIFVTKTYQITLPKIINNKGGGRSLEDFKKYQIY